MLLPPSTADFDRRWAAWLEHGRERDQLFWSRMRVVLPLMAVVTLLGGYFLLFR